MYSDGSAIDMHNLNLWVSQFRIKPPNFTRQKEKLDGGHGLIEIDTTVDTRDIRAVIQVEGYDAVDFDLLRDEIFHIFNPLDEFYIVRDLQPMKRYKAKVSDLSEINFEEGSLEDGQFEVGFEMLQPFAESIATTADVKEWDVDKWQWGMGLDWDDDFIYTFSSNSFVVKNYGNVPIDPRAHELEIIIKATASSYLKITNNTTGDVYKYNGVLTSNDTLVLHGVRTFKNGVSVFKNTNHKLLTLAVGENSFTVEGGTIISAAFNFRFLYK